MGAEDDDAEETDDELAALDEADPSSGKRVKRSASVAVELLVSDFKRRAKGLEGGALDAEFDRLVDRIVDRHVAIAPVGLQQELREILREKLAHDPTLSSALSDVRTAARIGRR